jgi:hypothetical protein
VIATWSNPSIGMSASWHSATSPRVDATTF